MSSTNNKIHRGDKKAIISAPPRLQDILNEKTESVQFQTPFLNQGSITLESGPAYTDSADCMMLSAGTLYSPNRPG